MAPGSRVCEVTDKGMVELIRSNDLVLLSYVRALLQAEHIEFVGLDEHMNMMDGNIGAIPRRVMVDDASLKRARQLLTDAGLAHVLKA
jgi:Putative prokaryotic signal transducing protein